MTRFILLGVVVTLAGLGMLGVALGGDRKRPRDVAMLIAGMMATAFGLVIGGFAIVYNTTAPLDLNAAEPAR